MGAGEGWWLEHQMGIASWEARVLEEADSGSGLMGRGATWSFYECTAMLSRKSLGPREGRHTPQGRPSELQTPGPVAF